ncbi:MAG TPA: hypothetical protein VGE36_04415 [Roseateles sp.]
MTISAGDIKLLKSETMADVPEGGGRPTGVVIVDGSSNEIFDDISDLDRTTGNVSVRKFFGGVRSLDDEGFFGVTAIISEPFEDPLVSGTLFSTGNTFDTRAEATARMEAYLAKGATYQGYLFGDHIAGQMNVTLLQRPEVALPPVGSTLVLTKVSTGAEQYIRITDLAVTDRTFTDQYGDFKRTQVTLDISDRLERDYAGFEALRYDSSIDYTGKTKIAETIVADAADYAGIVELEEDAEIGDLSVKVTGIYTQLVPSTRSEIGIADARMNQQGATLVEAGEAYSRNITQVFSTTQRMFVGGRILPGSLTIVRGGIEVKDKGGLLVDPTAEEVGAVDYDNGVMSLSTNVWGTSAGSHLVGYKPAYAPTLVSQSIPIKVTQEGQRLSWVITLDPPPARGTLQVSYRTLAQWYVLQEDGSGAIRGSDSALGAGTLNFATGTVAMTLGYLPDVESALIFTFVPAVVTRKLSALPNAAPTLPRAFGSVFSLGKAIKPGTLAITWNDGADRTATDAGGVLTGAATGAISYGEGLINFRPNQLPEKGTTITVAITEAVQRKESVTNFVDGGANWTFSLPAPLKAGTVELSVLGEYSNNGLFGWMGGSIKRRSYHLFDDGAGALRYANGGTNVAMGTVDYATGAVSIPKDWSDILVESQVFAAIGLGGGASSVRQSGYSVLGVTLQISNGPGSYTWEAPSWGWWGGAQSNAVEARYSGSDASGYGTSFEFNDLFLPANPAVFSDASGYSAKFSSFFIGASFYYLDQGTGSWVRDASSTTGVGTTAGINAVVGGMAGVLLTSWPAGASSAPTGVAGATQPATDGIGSLLSVDRAVFRTAVSPLVNSGFNLAGNWASTGTSFSVTANAGGVISSGTAAVGETPGSFGVFAVVDYEMGLCSVAFGRRVPVSMEGNADVIDISDLGIPGVTKIQSIPVQSDTLRYNATGYKYIPLSASVIGLNTVRLPPDGRVPIFRKGTVVVVGNTQETAPATYANDDTVDLGRVRLARAWLIDADGLVIDTGYTVNLDTGIVTIVNVTGWAQPVTIKHRVEDMALATDVQINGRISLNKRLTHNYEAGESYVSSALVFGTVRSRTSLVFDQVSWTGVWSDTPIGAGVTAQFDEANNPIVTNNKGALTERWALIFQNSTAFNVVGEHVGLVATGSINVDCSPMNPAAGTPYMTIPATGWGGGWAQGNVLRINTVGAMADIWWARTTLPGPESVVDDVSAVALRGGVDRP